MRETLIQLNAVTGMRGSLVVTPDGLPIAVDLPSDMDSETAAGISASLAKLLGDWAEQAGAGKLSIGILEARNARVFVASIAWGYLIGIAAKHCPIGEARSAIRTATSRVNTICADLVHAVDEEESAQAQPQNSSQLTAVKRRQRR